MSAGEVVAASGMPPNQPEMRSVFHTGRTATGTSRGSRPRGQHPSYYNRLQTHDAVGILNETAGWCASHGTAVLDIVTHTHTTLMQ